MDEYFLDYPNTGIMECRNIAVLTVDDCRDKSERAETTSYFISYFFHALYSCMLHR